MFHEKRFFTAPNEVRWFQAYGKLAHLSLHIPYNIVVSMHNSVPSANKRVVRWRKFAPPSFTGNWIPWRPMKRRWFHICILFFLEMINNSVRLKQPSFPQECHFYSKSNRATKIRSFAVENLQLLIPSESSRVHFHITIREMCEYFGVQIKLNFLSDARCRISYFKHLCYKPNCHFPSITDLSSIYLYRFNI